MSAPKVTIVLELEQSPKIILDAASDSEFVRLRHWLRTHPEIARVYDLAFDLQVDWQERAA